MGDREPKLPSGRYQYFGWTVSAEASDVGIGRLVETHEYFHRQLDDTTAFGGLITTVASLAEARPDEHWLKLRDSLQEMSDLVHEVFAVGTSLLTTQRPLQPIDGFPTYSRFVELAVRLIGDSLHPWLALSALRAACVACMQSEALKAAEPDLAAFGPSQIALSERPNHRLVALMKSSYADTVTAEYLTALDRFAAEPWWVGTAAVPLTPESMDGTPARESKELFVRLRGVAEGLLAASGHGVVRESYHREDLARVVEQAQKLVPEGLTRIGAFTHDKDMLGGGALDSQTITLPGNPARATILCHKDLSGYSGEGDGRHGFVVLLRSERLRRSYAVEGRPLPDAPVVAGLRTTVFDEETRDLILFATVDDPTELDDADQPIYVAVTSSAMATDPDLTSKWVRWAKPSRRAIVMDTPAYEALRKWCRPEGAVFRTQTRKIVFGRIEVRFIAGRIETSNGSSPLVVVPTTEFGARWFEQAVREDPVFEDRVVVVDDLFESESPLIDVVCTHLLLEEHVIGPGSWRQ